MREATRESRRRYERQPERGGTYSERIMSSLSPCLNGLSLVATRTEKKFGGGGYGSFLRLPKIVEQQCRVRCYIFPPLLKLGISIEIAHRGSSRLLRLVLFQVGVPD